MSSLWAQLRACSAAALPRGFPADTVALFPPRDDAVKALQLLLSSAAVSVTVEMFTYTDTQLHTILKAKVAVPGVAFQATFDQSEYNQIAAMKQLIDDFGNDGRVAIGRSEHGMIVHRKVVVIDHLYVANGSTNWTVVGERFEDNELVIRRNAPLAAWYEKTLNANHARILARAAAMAA